VSPEFLSVDDVLAIHHLQLERFGGSAGLRDLGLLESAVSQAEASFGGSYLHEDLFAMASAYLFSIAKNHPFVDGNKRAGLASALTFLDLNGIAIDHSSDLLYDATMAIAEGLLAKEELAELLRRLASSAK
jgi:death on curing protein